MAVNNAWVGQSAEEAIEPGMPILDAHFHIWDKPPQRPEESYLCEDFQADRRLGHNIVGAVYVECNAYYRADGPVPLRPVNETLFINAENERLARAGAAPLCEAIIGHANLSLGRAVGDVLDAHLDASPLRFRGIRHSTVWDELPELRYGFVSIERAQAASAAFRDGAACLAERGLTFDAWVYHPQLHEIRDLARSLPQLAIVVDHLGGPLGVGPYAAAREDSVAAWKRGLAELAACPNVSLKLGGMAMRCMGLGLSSRPGPPSSQEMAALTAPFYHFAIDTFGPDRCMFESNFPVDKEGVAYSALWNSFKLLSKRYTPAERSAMFHGTAARVYSIQGV